MKLRFWFKRYQLLFASILALTGTLPAAAQDRLILKDGRSQDVKIVGMAGNAVQIQVGAGTTAVPLTQVSEVQMNPPAEFKAAMDAYQKKDFKAALATLGPLVNKYRGLPTQWARQATATAGDIYVALNDFEKAEAAYSEFVRLYPGQGAGQSAVGLARIAVAKKDYAKALGSLEPLMTEALSKKEFTPGDAVAYSHAFALSGQIKEAQGDLAGALEDYCRTIAVFPADQAVVADAKQRADALRKKSTVVVP
jgi:tetratricopeptide (TPR) repeat protein